PSRWRGKFAAVMAGENRISFVSRRARLKTNRSGNIPLQEVEKLVTDHFRTPVPPERRVGGFAIGLVAFGVGITLPIFYLGAELGRSLGLKDAALVFFGGCALLGILCVLTAVVGALRGISCYMIVQFPFGREGAKIVNLLMA